MALWYNVEISDCTRYDSKFIAKLLYFMSFIAIIYYNILVLPLNSSK
jgi:hypothetical protein